MSIQLYETRQEPSNWLARRLLVSACSVALVCLTSSTLWASDGSSAAMPSDVWSVYRSIGLGAAAAVAISMSVLGASYAVARVGSAALGAAAEKPELLTRSIVFVALAEGLAILGFAIAMVLAQKV